MDTALFVGIDFGTCNSSIAWFNPKTQLPEIILNAEGRDKTPSLVYYGDRETLVGEAAQRLLTDLRLLGDETQAGRELWIIKSIKRNLINPPVIALGGEKYVRPVQVAAEILKKLKQDAEQGHFHETIERAVITYPAEFDFLQQDVIREAAQAAGFREIRLLKEPEAAAVAFSSMGQKVGANVLVYDLGGGTFDLSFLVREDGDSLQLALESDGDARFGGDDLDQALYDHCDALARQSLGRGLDFREPGTTNLYFMEECRKAKEHLSAALEATISCLIEGKPFGQTITKELFENLIREKVERTVRKTKGMVDRAARKGSNVDTVVLIGGSARIPLIRQRLTEVLPVAPLSFDKADLAVALGAAYYGHHLWQQEEQHPVDEAKGKAVPAAAGFMRFCTRCGTPNVRQTKFCQKCGAGLTQDNSLCPHCRGINYGQTHFCIHCGGKLKTS